VVRTIAAIASAAASSAGAAATASWFESPRQINPRREIAALARSIDRRPPGDHYAEVAHVRVA
jgi:hypothetical protein